MLILFWSITILVLGLVFGEIRYRLNHKKRLQKKEKINNLRDNSSSENDIHGLSAEDYYSDYIPLTTLSTRGSWRLGQGKALSYESFSTLRDEEYRKYLK